MDVRAPSASLFQAVTRVRVWGMQDLPQRGENKLTRTRILGSVSAPFKVCDLEFKLQWISHYTGWLFHLVQMFICLDIDTGKVNNEIHSALVLDRQTHDSVTEQGRGVVHDKLLQKGSPLSVSGGSSPPRTPARFAMPAARGKTSLNARDW